jgi:tetratricopeptide (TPR) repeat protein
MPIRGADGSSVQLHGGDSEASRPQKDVVETTSPPSRPVSRPKAPPLNFSSPRSEPAKPSETGAVSADSTPLAATTPDSTPVVSNAAALAAASTVDTTPTADSEAAVTRDVNRDEVSVPPVGLDSAFFEETLYSADASLEIEPRDTRTALKQTPRAARRRAHLARYVTVAVTLASALCAAALLKVARGREESPRRAEMALTLPGEGPGTAARATEPALDQPQTTEPAPSSAQALNSSPTGTPSQPQGESASAPAAQPQPAAAAESPNAGQPGQGGQEAVRVAAGGPAAATAEAVEVAPAGTSEAAVDAPRDPKEIAKEAANAKVKARTSLEWGKAGDAIVAGEKSVALDPTDAESWLILGAAYQEKGDSKNAVRSFQACLEQGKRGPRNECAAMLR